MGETNQNSSARRSKSRNKVAVGEPAAGSLPKSVLLRQADILSPRAGSQEPLDLVLGLNLASPLEGSAIIALIGGCLGSGVDEDSG